MAREHAAHQRFAVAQHAREAIEEPRVLLRAPVTGECVEACAQSGQRTEDLRRRGFTAGCRDRTEGRLPDEPRGGLAARLGARGDPGELVRPEADQLRGGAERRWGHRVVGQASDPSLLCTYFETGYSVPGDETSESCARGGA
jgi:hypothetical protein